MTQQGPVWIAVVLIVLGLPSIGRAAEEDATAHLKEMLRRTQAALREAQAQNAELARAKTEAEQKLQATTAQLDTVQSGAKSTQASLAAKLNSAEGGRAELERKLKAATEQLAASNARLGETGKTLAARGSELAEANKALELSKTANETCEAKNLALYQYSVDLLQRYKTKGVWAAMAQKDPVFGLKEVSIENVVQEYQLKLDSQKVKP